MKHYRASETLAVVVVVHGLDPTIPGFDRESTSKAFRSKQLIPVCIGDKQRRSVIVFS